MSACRCLWLGAILFGCGAGARSAAPPEPTTPNVAPDPGPGEAESARTAGLRDAFGAGRFDQVLSGCPRPEDRSAASDTRTWCMVLIPASLHALGRHPDALSTIDEVCRVMPPAGPKNDGRAHYLAMIMFMLSEAHGRGHFESESAERQALLENWLDTCRVSLPDVEKAIHRAQQAE